MKIRHFHFKQEGPYFFACGTDLLLPVNAGKTGQTAKQSACKGYFICCIALTVK